VTAVRLIYWRFAVLAPAAERITAQLTASGVGLDKTLMQRWQ